MEQLKETFEGQKSLSQDEIVDFESGSSEVNNLRLTECGRKNNSVEEKTKNSTGKHLIKEKTLTFTQSVTLVGLSHAIDENSSRMRRIIWIAWILFGFGLAFYQIQDKIIEYLKYPFDTKFQIMNVPEIEFPQVTICKENSVSKSKLKDMGLNEMVESWKLDLDLRSRREAPSSVDLLHNDTLQWEEILKNMTEPWAKNVTVFWDREQATLNEVKTDLGYCAALSTASHTLISTEGGIPAGLKIFIRDEENEFVQPLYTDQDALSGYRILIHDAQEVPLLGDAGFAVPFGSVSQIQISFENITNLGAPYGDCNEDPRYKFVNCLTEGLKSMFLEAFNCRLLYMSGDEQVCSYPKHRLGRVIKEYSYAKDFPVSCPQQCHRRIYKYSVTQSKFSRVHLQDILKLLELPDDTNVTAIYIYYPYLMYREIKSEPSYSFFSLLCDLGGALSLLLGATLLTIYEIGEFVFLITRDYFHYRTRKKSDLV